LSAPTIETSAAELLHNAPATPNVSRPPLSSLASRRILLLNQFEDLRRYERTQGATNIVGDVRERKEARECEKKQDCREQREEEVIRQLSRHAEYIISHDFTPRAARECRPRERYRLCHTVVKCKC
jgi:hypothetical protein